jgi:hypothetical protein
MITSKNFYHNKTVRNFNIKYICDDLDKDQAMKAYKFIRDILAKDENLTYLELYRQMNLNNSELAWNNDFIQHDELSDYLTTISELYIVPIRKEKLKNIWNASKE